MKKVLLSTLLALLACGASEKSAISPCAMLTLEWQVKVIAHSSLT